ncbi:acyl-CoA dehydrogenase family protein [Nocardioides marmotae]|uniref:acyl-CoA dehydrogenase family protein n=1 Tax=Nocardioides marmotae TaxID=2663857 RepID=UPI0012B6480E|nr:acyl-CoA dehydrogenase family protein [Nocardioides marmotae]MBC9732337.1 acyl-CoA dehydrogenase family protein [Nocardioides marmotae]MTB83457.1 acyl-CoA dehydrogenase [Nocardioides marmotae]
MTVDTATDAEATTVREAVDRLLAEHPPSSTDRVAFLGAQFDAGLAWVHFPEGKGGRGLRRGLQSIVNRRLEEAGAPSAAAGNPLGYSMGAPTVLAWGTEEQHHRYLRPLFTGEERWCQLFSEPGAGSDLAGVATRAVKDGDTWTINGQKVWNSMASISDIGMLVARTDPEKAKHSGLTYFVIDMHAPGVDVRPLRQMTGEAEFNEVYLTDTRVPDANRLGGEGEGWKVSLATLMNERVMFASESMEIGPVDKALAIYHARETTDPELRSRMIDLYVRTRILGLSNARAAANLAAGTPGPEGSTGKIGFSEINQLGYELCVDLMGDEGALYDDYEMHEFTVEDMHARRVPDVRRSFLRSRANSIEGGTSEIMRNILAERVLGLPPEHRVDKDRPFSQVPRN